MEEIKIYEQELFNKNGKVIGKLAVLCGALNSETPIRTMRKVVEQYVGKERYNEFIEIALNNPWTRIVITNIDNLPLKKRKFKINE